MKKWIAPLCLLVSLAGCGKTEIQCADELAKAPVVDLVKEQLEKVVADQVTSDDASAAGSIGPGKIRAAIAKLTIAIEDIRTSKEDPNSTKRSCAGTLKIRFPVDILNNANKARAAMGMNSVADLADASDVEHEADSYSTSLSFSIQPTDDGKKVFAETDSQNPIMGFAAAVLAHDLLHPVIEGFQRQQQQVEQQQQAESEAALAEQRKANLELAQTENKLAIQVIGAVWQSLPADARDQLLPLQRAWIKKKTADCRVESAGTSTEPTEIETARLNCEARENQSRTNWLRQYQTSEE